MKQNLVPLFCLHLHGQKRQKGVENEKERKEKERNKRSGSKAIHCYLTLDEIFPVIPIFKCPCGDTSKLANISTTSTRFFSSDFYPKTSITIGSCSTNVLHGSSRWIFLFQIGRHGATHIFLAIMEYLYGIRFRRPHIHTLVWRGVKREWGGYKNYT